MVNRYRQSFGNSRVVANGQRNNMALFFVSMISLKGFVNKEKQKHKTLGASAGNANGKIVYDSV